jgi:hypothetical protein
VGCRDEDKEVTGHPPGEFRGALGKAVGEVTLMPSFLAICLT